MTDQGPHQFLSGAKPGDKLVVAGLDGGRRANMRLRSLGISKGDQIEVVNRFGGQIVVAGLHARLVIGHGFAGKIIVRPLQKDKNCLTITES